MFTGFNKEFRKIARNFKGRIELMKKIPLYKIEAIFLELYEKGLQEYIEAEMKRFPNKTRKEIIIERYRFHEKLRKRKR
ncbi:MAG: hypothetical protein ACP6IY_08805 [Promethearchaeia archaeon]